MRMPKVSVLMPVFNHGQYVDNAVRSILEQTFQDFEFIIINDGSTDQTSEILLKMTDPRISVIKIEHNSGMARALNRGIHESRGEYIARMDADDVSHPKRLERQVTFLDQHPEVAVVGTMCWMIDAEGKKKKLGNAYAQDREIKWLLSQNSGRTPLWHPSVMMRRAHLFEVGLYREDLDYAIDKELWLRMARKGYRFANIQEPLLDKREPVYRHDYQAHIKRHRESRDKVYKCHAETVLFLKCQYHFSWWKSRFLAFFCFFFHPRIFSGKE
ncbi:MAG: glycosyltransferase [Candidatus Omnitrophica bacterium]|nr:glycosyltransferase [Candidatus Omnitrophota bacterium]